ncbi:2Fe-2S iron-sulfur cluster binding domain-containing protein [Acidaminobacter sp. JC074]|uniref:(2Fe-2S)-binding protein n=1 Tax=Acidaminobacter sp. JC074 TaxID=2530199 RepID=UPI001F111236|nr:2Fe-2S iron-sulfur cluster-binding protein [Acidaminobacter sp. JC074]MCH4889752.1 2Fe-2S iron-sulfur cluster binding domain-containing protein [Acidaminobacter sp. JC074]
MEVKLIINGSHYKFAAEPDEYLLDTLRKLGYKSVKRGCDQTSCGVCSILVDGNLVPSCSYLTIRANNKPITTVEGIQEEARKIAKFITEEGVDQCGFCSPGHVMAIYAMMKDHPHPSIDEIKHYLAGNLCRCSGYEGQHRALKKMLEVK